MKIQTYFPLFLFVLSSTSFAGVKESRSMNHLSFLSLVAKHQDLLSLLPIKKSGLKSITILPHSKYPDADPGYLLETKNLLIGPLAQCPNKHKLDFSPIHLHEFAHTVFTENFYSAFKLNGEAPVQERYNPSKRAPSEKLIEFNKVVTHRDLIEPFDEVFADTFASLALNNPSALQSVLIACGTQDVARDFSIEYPIRGWNRGTLKPTLLPYSIDHYSSTSSGGNNQTLFLDAKVHNILSPFRSHIWKHFLKSSQQDLIKNKILKWVYLVSIKITREFRSKEIRYGDWFQISKEELNQYAILEFDRLARLEK